MVDETLKMSLLARAAGMTAVLRGIGETRRSERAFYVGMAALILVTVSVGFARSYYRRDFVGLVGKSASSLVSVRTLHMGSTPGAHFLPIKRHVPSERDMSLVPLGLNVAGHIAQGALRGRLALAVGGRKCAG
jgi:hypothetical protein